MLKVAKILVLIVSLTAAYAQKNSLVKDKKMIKVAIRDFSKWLDPVKAYAYQHFILIQCIHDTLLHLDEAGNISSELVRSWKVSNSRLKYTFKLNTEAKFHNGDNITVEDVIFSISRHMWKKNDSIVRIYLEPIQGYKSLKDGSSLEGIKIVDKETIEITLKRPTPSFLYILTMPSFSILSKKEALAGNIVGSGRMELKKEKTFFKLSRWDHYKGKRPTLENIEVFEYFSGKTIKQNIENGSFDMILGLSTETAESVKNENLKKDNFKTLTYSHLFYNNSKPIFKNKEFRKNLTLLLQKVASSAATKTQFLEFSPYYFPKGILPRNYYREISFKDVTFEKFSKKWKNELKKQSLNIVLLEDVYPRTFIDELVNGFKSFNINIKVEAINIGFNKRLKDKSYDVISGLYMGNFPDPDGFIEPIIQNEEYSYGVMPIEAKLDEIININTIDDVHKRLEKYANLFKEIEEEYYFAPLFQDKIPLLFKKSLSVTNSAYRYESELWKIFWKEEK